MTSHIKSEQGTVSLLGHQEGGTAQNIVLDIGHAAERKKDKHAVHGSVAEMGAEEPGIP